VRQVVMDIVGRLATGWSLPSGDGAMMILQRQAVCT